ncbi:MAG: hypothetical protein HQM09_03965 [Candidatus Riflebacteria bacterium]|nr:hypothetical protein [Candidatus Riflebacteria bacterium]
MSTLLLIGLYIFLGFFCLMTFDHLLILVREFFSHSDGRRCLISNNLRQAAENGHVDAQITLGLLYLRLSEDSIGMHWLRRSESKCGEIDFQLRDRRSQRLLQAPPRQLLALPAPDMQNIESLTSMSS